MKSNILMRNYISIAIYTITRIIINFVYIRLIITNYGSEINGFLSTVMSIMSYLNIVEAGVGFATTYSLYRPLTENNFKKANSVLSFTDKYFKKIGVLLSIIMLIIAFIYPHLTDISNKGLGSYIIIVFSLITLTEYYFDGKYKLLMNADQKMDLVNIVGAISYLCSYGLAIMLCIFKRDISLVISALLFTIPIRLSFIFFVKKRYYTWINFKEIPDKKVWNYSNDIFIQKISSLAFNTTDIILISVFVGIKEVSVYAVYNLVLSGLNSIMSIISEAPVNIFGKLYSEGNTYKFSRIYRLYEHFCIIITTVLGSCWFILIQPFINIYTEQVNDINYYNIPLSFFMGIYFIITFYRSTAATTLNIAGYFEIAKKIYLIELIINIILSILLLNIFGVSGVILASVFAKTYSLIHISKIVYDNIIIKSYSKYLYKVSINITVVVICCILSYKIPILVFNFIHFIFNSALTVIIIGIFTLVINAIFEKEDTKDLNLIIMNKIKKGG